MSLSLYAVDSQLVVSNLAGNGVLSTNNDGTITTANPVVESQLSTELQDKINAPSDTNLDQIAPMITDVTTRKFPNFGAEWKTLTNAPGSGTNIVNIGCSGDGKVVVVCAWSVGTSRISNDYGNTWFDAPPQLNSIYSCAVSLDGQYILAVSSSMALFVSSDYGHTFQSINPPTVLYSVAMSATGRVMLAGGEFGVYISSDFGSSWTSVKTNAHAAVSVSEDGSILYAVQSTVNILYSSTDNGVNWNAMYTATGACSSLRCSATGKYVLMVVGSRLLMSTDFGDSFSIVGTSTSVYSCALSSNGMYMISGSLSGGVFETSTDYGQTWSTYSGGTSYSSVVMSNDGFHMYRMSPDVQMIANYANTVVFNTVQPAIPTAGSVYFDTDAGTLHVYNGVAWFTFNPSV